MLKIIQEVDSIDLSIRIDGYVPFAVKVVETELSYQPIYWRCGDGKRSLVEFRLNRNSGVVRGITLTMINKKYVNESKAPINNELPEASGMAVFDTSAWGAATTAYADNFQDEFDHHISLTVGTDYLTSQFESIDSPVRYLKNGQLRFGLTKDGTLSGVEITGLSITDTNLLKSFG